MLQQSIAMLVVWVLDELKLHLIVAPMIKGRRDHCTVRVPFPSVIFAKSILPRGFSSISHFLCPFIVCCSPFGSKFCATAGCGECK